MIANCFLHIGTEKTGTTTIQHFLAHNREALREQGIVYPRTPGRQNHTRLAVYALGRTRLRAKRRGPDSATEEERQQFRDGLISGLDDELRDETASTVIFSNEHLSSRVVETDRIRKIKLLCARYANSTKVIVYIRNQVDFLVSSYGTVVKAGGKRKFPYPLSARRIRTMDYKMLLSPWENIFGSENLIVRRFEAADFVDGNLVADFASIIPFSCADLKSGNVRNAALSAKALAFLREFNKRVPPNIGAVENPQRGAILRVLRTCTTGPALTVSQEMAENIMGLFAASNRRVSRRYFDGKHDPLFNPPKYVGSEEAQALLSLDVEIAMDIAAKLWCEQQERFRRRGRPVEDEEEFSAEERQSMMESVEWDDADD